MRKMLCVAALTACLAAAVLINMNIRTDNYAVLQLCTLALELLAFGLPALLWHARSKARLVGLRSHFGKPSVLQVGVTLLMAVSATVAAAFVAALWSDYLSSVGWSVRSSGIMPPGASVVNWVLLLLSTAIAPALCEELLFRGTLLNWLRRHMSPMLANLLTTVFFALCHFNVEGFPAILLVGWALGFLFLRTDNLFLPMLFHAAYNAAVIVVSLSEARLYLPLCLVCTAVFMLCARAIGRMRS